MVDAIVSVVLQQLISMADEETKQQVRLIMGVGKEVKRLRDKFEAIQTVLIDAEQRQVKEAAVRLWLEKLKDTSYDMEDVLDERNTTRLKLEHALIPQQQKVCSFFPVTSCFGLKQIFLRRDFALKIKAINEKLDDITRQKDMFNLSVLSSTDKSERIPSTSLIDVSEVQGRDEEKKILKNKLLCESSIEEVEIISMVGMGGIGKTTLAQFAFNDSDVINNFQERIWVCVSSPFDEFKIAKAIIESLEGSSPNLGELNSLLQHIHASIMRKKFLLILDDVWTDDYNKWEPFRRCLMNGLHGSKILITTRKETVAGMMESTNVIFIKELSEHECWSLFKRVAFFGRSALECEQLEEIGRKIVGMCRGLPLAAKTIGSLLRFKRTGEEWQSILDSEMWQLEEFEKDLLAPLLLSYNDLPSMVKRCFSYCVVFPKDYNIKKVELVKLWMAQGYIVPKENKEMEIIGQECFDYLATRSFFQEFRKGFDGNIISCKMHDMVHDFAQFLTKNECVAIEVDGPGESSLINTNEGKLRHSMLVFSGNASFPVSLFNAKKLRSLLIDNRFRASSSILPGLFDQLTCLRTLKITGDHRGGNSRCKISKEIQKLIHLRYLELVELDIEELPEACCELFNLQTLEIKECVKMKRLPQGIGKLVNLRHLRSNDGYLDYMPKGIQRLTCLRTLSEFVSVSSDSKYASKACNLEGLRQLNRLRGSLKIRRLGNETDVGKARIADLEKKKNVIGLELLFDKEATEEMNETNDANHEAIIEALQPPPNLESLQIEDYKGKTVFPSWIVLLNKLKKLILSNCNKCEMMPPLGKLPSLEILNIWNMESVKRVSGEFLGIESDDGSSSVYIAFPILKTLTLMGLSKWEEWDFGKEKTTIMPQLNSLYIRRCRKLKLLPEQVLRSITLETLVIDKCPNLRRRFRKGTEHWSKISHIPNIKNHNDYYVKGGPR